MYRMGVIGLMAASLSLGACATDRYGYNDGYNNNDRQAGRALGGAAIGAAAGAGVGAVVDGVSPVEGAIVGALGGAAIGAATANNRSWYRDDRGYCYYVDDGRRVYDYNRGC